ncbi:unnamed protein product [Eruca vesicaria subsp. sativa]|uniref:Uncharacterized protein n=1 Tax=Eruca vesicaria subsp. sativa TaxID=29727 RepID=A0ABC8KHH7_ERUVS|nr:unnamed protein product [Eruca vesicaria subsp. sativa]
MSRLLSPCFAVPMIQNLEATLRAGAAPNTPQFRPQGFSQEEGLKPSEKGFKSEDAETSVATEKVSTVVVSASKEKVKEDPLGDARSKIQEEITREFAALMAEGTLRASEAATIATKRVMQKYGHLNAAA